MPDHLSWSEAAALVGGADVLKAACARLEIASEVIDGRRMIHRDSLDAWMARPRTWVQAIAQSGK